jgi:hypothetical protein
MQKMSIATIAILLFVQILSNGFAQIPAGNNDETLDSNVETPSLTSARNNTTCGSDPSLTDLWASTDSSTWGTWTNAVYGYYDVNCTVIGNNYTLEATINANAGGWSSYSFWNWSETNNHEYMSEAWANLSAGTYCVNVTLWDVTTGTSTYVDSDYPCFTLTNSSGSGGNNTGGNNTGGNNTGGNNTGGNNTGGNNTGGNNTGCGYDLNYSSINASSYYYAYDLGQNFSGYYDVYCGLLNTGMLVSWYIEDLDNNNQTVDFGFVPLNANQYSTSVIINSTDVANESAGNYSFEAQLHWWNGTAWNFVDSDIYYFIIYNSNNNNTGGNNTGGNNTGGNNTGGNNTGGNNTAGNNTGGNNQTNPLMPVNCSQIAWNASMNVTINDCWNQTDSFWFFFNQSGAVVWIDPIVAVGYDYIVYSGPSIVSVEIPLGYGDDVFDLYVFWNNGWHDSGFDIYGGVTYTFSTPVERMSIRGIEASEMLDPNDPTAFVSALTFQTSGTVLMTMTPVTENYTVLTCGNDPSMTDLMIWTDAQSYPQGTTVYSDYYVNCSVNTKDYELHVFAYSTSGSSWSDYAVWNWTETDSYEMMDDSWSNLAQDTYCVNATLYMVSGGAYQFVDFEVTCFTVTGNSSGGGGSTPLDPCGLNSSYTDVWSWMDASTYANGDDQDATFYVNCTRTGADYTLEYYVFEVGSTNYVLSGMFTWIATSTNINFYDTFTGLGPGDYCVLANLYEANVFLTDNGGTTCFTITGTAVNSPPTISYTLQIPVAYSGDALDCYAQGATYSDPDNDPDQSIFTWNVNNVQITTGILNNILPAGSFVVGDIVHCEAIAHDGMAQGNTMNRYYFVQPPNNTAPSVSNVVISPTSPTETDTLTCSYIYNDPDMDPDASTIQWSVNGVAIAGATTDTLSSGYATADFVTCAVTAFDGTVSGNTGTMSILIMSSASSGGGGLPSIGVVGTIAAISAGFIFAIRREDDE